MKNSETLKKCNTTKKCDDCVCMTDDCCNLDKVNRYCKDFINCEIIIEHSRLFSKSYIESIFKNYL